MVRTGANFAVQAGDDHPGVHCMDKSLDSPSWIPIGSTEQYATNKKGGNWLFEAEVSAIPRGWA